MTTFNDEELEKLMRLSRIQCNDLEKSKLKDALAKVITYIKQLDDVPTEGVEPVRSIVQTLQSITRDDRAYNELERDTFLSNAPTHIGGMIKVPPVMKPAS